MLHSRTEVRGDRDSRGRFHDVEAWCLCGSVASSGINPEPVGTVGVITTHFMNSKVYAF